MYQFVRVQQPCRDKYGPTIRAFIKSRRAQDGRG